MRIFFDAYELRPGRGKSIGIYNYAKNLFAYLCENLPDGSELIACCNQENSADFSRGGFRGVEQVVIGGDGPGKFARQIWNAFGAALVFKRQGCDVYFSPKGFLPFGLKLLSPRSKAVVVIHDLIPFWYKENYPGYFGRLEQFLVEAALGRAARRADQVIAISEATANDISTKFSVTGRLTVVYNGVLATRASERLVQGRYIFAVTSALPHKNAVVLLEAYQHYRNSAASPLQLVVCGVRYEEQDGVTFVTGISDADLHSYFKYSAVTLFLSLIEGFGFPAVEALHHGVPIICSDIPVLKEITQGRAVYTDPRDPNIIGEVLQAFLDESIDGYAFGDEARAIARSYSWDRCAKSVFGCITLLAEEGK